MEQEETDLIEFELRQEPELVRQKEKSQPFLFAHQRDAFRELQRTALAFSQTKWWDLSIRPRFDRLLVAPTGTGKTHLVQALAEFLKWPFLSISASNWVLFGCPDRGGKQTWPLIASWLAGGNSFRLLFLDELDKVSGDDTWSRHLRTELYNLLDRTIPPGLQFDGSGDGEEHVIDAPKIRRTKSLYTLRFRTLILGGAAFQDAWEERRVKRAGFHLVDDPGEPPTHDDLTSHLPRELLNRFGPLVVMRPLAESDYEKLLAEAVRCIPDGLRENFLRIGRKAAPAACRDGKGARFIEEVLTNALIDTLPRKLQEKRQKSVRLSAG
ncbi:MAG: AAA family ATPase [Chthoniobacterales bacterium]|nr:AAA family ATPase [Chthoniobacterales bacterium]